MKVTIMKYLPGVFLLCISFFSIAQTPKKMCQAERLPNDIEIVIDGILDEGVWQTATYCGDFTQFEPYEGREPSQQTEFAILYDKNNLYIAIKASDTNPEEIIKRLSRRDDLEGDRLIVNFDSYHDLRTSFAFQVSAAGVKGDFILSLDGDRMDDNWNPIWYVKTALTQDGWVAELKIPFTQLRFDSEFDVWGLQVKRFIARNGEESFWEPMHREEAGWVRQYGELGGITGIIPHKPLDITPYAVGQIENYNGDPDNPFWDKPRPGGNVGVDAKIGLTNNLVLDLSVNPDFGQVEADPSVVNLTAFETFFEEKRQFFIEGSNIFTMPVGIGDGDMGGQNLFYSRRIGRRPHFYPELNPEEYEDRDQNTTILSAAKISGKTSKGWSIGVLDCVTANEYSEISDGENTQEALTEPLTHYFVGRVQRDLNEGNTMLGGIFTSVNRDLQNPNMEFLVQNAFTGGLDMTQFLFKRKAVVEAKVFGSYVAGTTDAITRLQEYPGRYFQRPDAEHLSVDTTLTSLTGNGGLIHFAKVGGNFNTGLFYTWKSPGLEVNDIGFLPGVDERVAVHWMNYRIWEPFWIFRSMRFNFSDWVGFDYGNTLQNFGVSANMHAQFKNRWWFSYGVNINSRSISSSALRGGPALEIPGARNNWIWMSTDMQKKLVFSFSSSAGKGLDESSWYYRVSPELNWKPLNNISFGVEPMFRKNNQVLQYVSEEYYDEESRYIFANLEQSILSLSLRVNLTISPDMTIQYWGQPFFASGSYNDFKYISDPLNNSFSDRYAIYSDEQITFYHDDEYYGIDENLDGVEDYTVGLPDFNVKEFLSNFVFRWEYQPGSTVYLVWSQTRDHFHSDGRMFIQDDFPELWDEKPYNVFLVKLSYRIGIH